MKPTTITSISISDQLATATEVARQALLAYESESLAAFEGRSTVKSLEKVIEINKQAKRRVAELTAAQATGVARDAKLAEDAAKAEQEALQATIKLHIGKVTVAAARWDTALDALAEATFAYEAVERESHFSGMPHEIVRKLESARNNTMMILGERLWSLIGQQHRPPFLQDGLDRLVNHLPTI